LFEFGQHFSGGPDFKKRQTLLKKQMFSSEPFTMYSYFGQQCGKFKLAIEDTEITEF